MTTSTALSSSLLASTHQVVKGAFAATFSIDPILGPEVSRLHSVLGSVVKRHGPLLEEAIATALEQSGHFDVYRNLRVPLTDAAIQVVKSNSPLALRGVRLRLDSEAVRSIDLDIAAVDLRTGTAFGIEVKRGGGATEGRKRTPLLADLQATRLLLVSFFRQMGYSPDFARTALIDYYGASGFEGDLVVRRADLDAFFGVPVVNVVDATTAELRRNLDEFLPALIGSAFAAEFELSNSSAITPPAHNHEDDSECQTLELQAGRHTPKRRGRPLGSKNRPKSPHPNVLH